MVGRGGWEAGSMVAVAVGVVVVVVDWAEGVMPSSSSKTSTTGTVSELSSSVPRLTLSS